MYPDQYVTVWNSIMPELYKVLTTYVIGFPRESVFTSKSTGVETSVFKTIFDDLSHRSVFVGQPGTHPTDIIPLINTLCDPNTTGTSQSLYSLSKEYLPYLKYNIIPIPPLRQQQATDPMIVRSIGTSSYTPVEVGGSVGYYGIADAIAAGLFYPNTDGVPAIAEPYLLNINNTLDVPLSSLATQGQQTLDVLNQIKTEMAVNVANTSDIKLNTSNTVLGLSAISTQLVDVIDILSSVNNKLSTTNQLLEDLNVGSGGSGIAEAVKEQTSVITSLLTFAPPRQVRVDTGVFENELKTYKPMSLSEITARGLFSSNPIRLDGPMNTLDYGFAPYLSASAPFQGGYDAPSGRLFAQYLQPEYPVGVPSAYQDELSGSNSVYLNERYDPYWQYHNGAWIDPVKTSPNTLVYTISKTIPNARAETVSQL